MTLDALVVVQAGSLGEAVFVDARYFQAVHGLQLDLIIPPRALSRRPGSQQGFLVGYLVC